MVLELHIELLGTNPGVWRRVLVPKTITLAELHAVIQAAFGWNDSHLHEFMTGLGERYGIPDPEYDAPGSIKSESTPLTMALGKTTTLHYLYDFGDDWEHRIRVKETLLALEEQALVLPACTGGACATPPDDCGGVLGYAEFVRAMANRHHRKHEEMAEWIGTDKWNAKAFDIGKVNARLSKIKLQVEDNRLRTKAATAMDSFAQAEAQSWWAKAYGEADPAARFGPAERNELGRLVDELGLDLGNAVGHLVPLSYTTLHGYLCCIVVGPTGLSPSVWLKALLPFPDEPTAHYLRLLALMRGLVAELEKDFSRPNPLIRLPALGIKNGGSATKIPPPPLRSLNDWCTAFLQAVALQPAKWDPFNRPREYACYLLEPFWHNGTPNGEREREELFYQGCSHSGHFTALEARQMTADYMRKLLPLDRRAAEIRRHLKSLWEHWHGVRDFLELMAMVSRYGPNNAYEK